MALNEFEGTLMLVSHDRALLRSVCDEFWLVGRGVVADFDGDLDDYQRYLLDEAKRMREEAKEATRAVATPAVAAPAVPSAQQRNDKQKPLQREIAQIDEQLARASADKNALETRMAGTMAPAEMADAGRRLKVLNEQIATLEERWISLSDQLEALAA